MNFRRDIQGLRAIAILLVVAVHYGVPGFSGGYVGVDVFFVISGYLITAYLLREIALTDGVNLVAFYGRRARRLIPVSLVTMTATLVAGALLLAPSEQKELAGTATYQLVYASNFFFIRHALDYFGPDSASNPLLHMWSLAAEEQIYLIWPAFLIVIAKLAKCGIPTWGAIASICIASFVLSVYLTSTDPVVAFYGSPTRLWEFGAGALVLFVPRIPLWYARLSGWAGLAAIGVAAFVFNDRTPFPGFAALVPVLGAAAFIVAGDNDRSPARMVLETRPFQFVGNISYSWYLWHWPVIVFAGVLVLGELSAPERAACAAVSLALATLTFYLVERPTRYLPVLTKWPAHTLGGAAVMSAVVLCAALLARASADAELSNPRFAAVARAKEELALAKMGCVADFTDERPIECKFDHGAAMKVVLFGDFHAAQWFLPLKAVAERRGWNLYTLTKSSCPAADVPTLYNERLRRAYAECDRWRAAAIDAIRRIAPSIVVITNYAKGYDIEPDRWGAAINKTLRAIAAPDLQIVLLRDFPDAPFDPTQCVARRGYVPSCSFRRGHIPNDKLRQSEQEAARGVADVSFIDLDGNICPNDLCSAARSSVLVFRDQNHLSNGFALSLADELNMQLSKALR